MDLVGEIVEHDVQEPVAPVPMPSASSTGFPKLKVVDFKRGPLKFKAQSQPRREASQKSRPEEPETEAQRIHKENLEKISLLTEEEITRERQELLQGLDPKLVQSLLNRTEKRVADDHSHHTHAEGHDGWIGGGKNGVELPHLDADDVNKALGVKSVKFSDEDDVRQYPLDHFEDKDDEEMSEVGEDAQIAPDDYQIVPEEEPEPEMHFPKPKRAQDDPDMDINDPDFFDKLHEKYYPDLPKETTKLEWMTKPMPQAQISTYEAISDMRFDFSGNLVELSKESQDVPTYLGLHHHSDSPQLPGYTLAELVHLSRSVVPTQRCLGIQVLGRILHKLGLHKYNIAPIVDDDNEVLLKEHKELMEQFEGMMWDLIDQLRVIESLTEAADEKKTRNLSVRTYAIEALWLWKQGGGRPASAVQKSEEDVIAEQLQNM